MSSSESDTFPSLEAMTEFKITVQTDKYAEIQLNWNDVGTKIHEIRLVKSTDATF